MTSILLDPTRECFAQSYARHGVAARAARDSGIAEKTGQRWLEEIDIQLRLEELRIEIGETHRITRDDVINNLAKIALADTRKLFSGANLRAIDKLDDATAEAIDCIEITEGYDKEGAPVSGLKVKTVSKRDKLKALQELGKHFNIYADHEKSGAGTMIVNIEGKDARL
jgi:hypothetical protein